jgi:NAD(P)-dependent dehydrogenase (short-subunit alcohol dehydrogenase family)
MHFANMSLYLGSKGAIEQFARSLSLELGPRNVTVNVLSPGFTNTDMLPEQYRDYGASLSPFNRVGAPEDVADWPRFSRVTLPAGLQVRTYKPVEAWCERSVRGRRKERFRAVMTIQPS